MVSGNSKTGAMPVSTSSKDTCPDACPFKRQGCYAKGGALNIHWKKVSEGERGVEWGEFLAQVQKIHKNAIWRMNQAGDLVGAKNRIDGKALADLVTANKGKRGFTYTHYPYTLKANLKAIKEANENGFTVNISTNKLSEVDKAMETGLPVTTVLPFKKYSEKVLTTEAGNKVLICPSSFGKEITCEDCQLCQQKDRKFAIGFIAHGVSKNKIG